MRDKFIEFYQPTKKELDNSWKNGLICLDANVLLNLYRYTENTRKDFLQVLNIISNRLWIPYQAGFEYHNNRLGVIRGHKKTYKNIIEKLEETETKLKSEFNKYKKHPFNTEIESILKALNNEFIKTKKDLTKLEKRHPIYSVNDPILRKLEKLLKGHIGNPLQELSSIYKEGKIRYENETPPGYRDQKEKAKEGDQSLYGDLIIWKELIKKAKEANKPMIFVTDDRKEDWYDSSNGETLGPRRELIKEFYDETKIRILIYQADTFLKYAKTRFKTTVKESSISEIKEIRVEDELKYFESNLASGINSLTYGLIKRNPGMYNINQGLDASFGLSTNPPGLYQKNQGLVPIYEPGVNWQTSEGFLPLYKPHVDPLWQPSFEPAFEPGDNNPGLDASNQTKDSSKTNNKTSQTITPKRSKIIARRKKKSK